MIKQEVKTEQKQMLSQSSQMLLQCLSMPLPQLCDWVERLAMSNPFIEVELSEFSALPAGFEGNVEFAEKSDWHSANYAEEDGFTQECPIGTKSFSEYLNAQLGENKHIDAKTRGLCELIIGCLNPDGYFDCTLEELVETTGVSRWEIEQALFIVQDLEPAGVGARDLSECLQLQLARGSDFNEINLHLIRYGLPLLAKKDYTALAKLLGVSAAKVKQAGKIVAGLEPIPSRGFGNGDNNNHYAFPEACLTRTEGGISVELNERAYPAVSLNGDYCRLIGDEVYPAEQEYLKSNQAAAKTVISVIDQRKTAMKKLITKAVKHQMDFFTRGEPLKPLKMSELADELGVSTSTVSRMVKDKYVIYDGRPLPLKAVFSSTIPASEGAISSDAVKYTIKKIISAEDRSAPFSDEQVAQKLAELGYEMSRRTVAEYRRSLGLMTASKRKKTV